MKKVVVKSPRVVVAMSGGVDSSVAAALLLEAGYRVEGVSLRLWDSARRDDRVCSDARDAERVSAYLGIPYTTLDRRDEFDRRVVTPFVRDTANGRTPNPCIACNSDFKLGRLLEWALAQGVEMVATGHYARVERREGRVRLFEGRDPTRDQSYFLFRLNQRQLERTLLPLGDLRKEDVRAHARRLGLPVAEKPESQDLCFGKPGAFAGSRGHAGGPGEIVTPEGRRLGAHAGIEGFTVGQRRGLGVSEGRPLYVHRLEAATRRVVVSPERPSAARLVAREWTWIAEPLPFATRLRFRIRYRHGGAEGRLGPADAEGCRPVELEEPVVAVTPGQAVVAYRGAEVVGGGWIERAAA